MLLAIDTSTHYASVAAHDGKRLLAEQTWLANQEHSRSLLPNIQRILADSRASLADVEAVAVALGPGSFNGLRVGLSTAKGLAIARNVQLVGASTLELIAAEYHVSEVRMNAGRGRVYEWTRDGGGPATDKGSIQLVEGTAPDYVRHAGVLAEIGWQRYRAGQVLDPTTVQPLYVQPPHITQSATKPHMNQTEAA